MSVDGYDDPRAEARAKARAKARTEAAGYGVVCVILLILTSLAGHRYFVSQDIAGHLPLLLGTLSGLAGFGCARKYSDGREMPHPIRARETYPLRVKAQQGYTCLWLEGYEIWRQGVEALKHWTPRWDVCHEPRATFDARFRTCLAKVEGVKADLEAAYARDAAIRRQAMAAADEMLRGAGGRGNGARNGRGSG